MTFIDLVNKLIGFGNTLITYLIGIAFIVMVVSWIKYFTGKDGGKDKEKWKHILLASVGGMFIIVSMWGLVRLIGKFLAIV